LAALLLPLGALGDGLGRKPALLAGLAVFGAASMASGLANGTVTMLAARLVAGVGAALIMPATLAIITSTFPPAQRSEAVGIWTAAAGGGGVLGMLVSAALVDLVGWRWFFALPVLLVMVALPLGLRGIPNTSEPFPRGYDLAGALTSLAGVVGLILGLSQGPEKGWTSPAAWAGLLLGAAGVIGFVAVELGRPWPLLDPRLLRRPGLAVGSMTLLAVFGVPTGVFVLLYPYLQMVRGWTGLGATLALMPMPVLMIACSALRPG